MESTSKAFDFDSSSTYCEDNSEEPQQPGDLDSGHEDEIIPRQTTAFDPTIRRPEAIATVQLQHHLPDYPPQSQQDAVKVAVSDQLGYPKQETSVTSLMIRNIPYKMTLKGLMSIIDTNGFAGTYDFLHLPGRGYHFSNLGYAFINFCSSVSVAPFVSKFHGIGFSKLSGINTEKIIEIRPAHAQGLAHNVAKVRHIMSSNDGSSLFVKDSR